MAREIRNVGAFVRVREASGNGGQRVAIAFGREDGAIHSQFVYEAAREAHFLKYDRLYLFGFAIQAKARELVEDRAKLRISVTYVTVTPDVVMADLLKTSHTNQIFSVTGLPDVRLKPAGRSDNGEPLYQAQVLGLDIFKSGEPGDPLYRGRRARRATAHRGQGDRRAGQRADGGAGAGLMDCAGVSFSGHALRRMFERGLNEHAILDTVAGGEVIAEYPDD